MKRTDTPIHPMSSADVIIINMVYSEQLLAMASFKAAISPLSVDVRAKRIRGFNFRNLLRHHRNTNIDILKLSYNKERVIKQRINPIKLTQPARISNNTVKILITQKCISMTVISCLLYSRLYNRNEGYQKPMANSAKLQKFILFSIVFDRCKNEISLKKDMLFTKLQSSTIELFL